LLVGERWKAATAPAPARTTVPISSVGRIILLSFLFLLCLRRRGSCDLLFFVAFAVAVFWRCGEEEDRRVGLCLLTLGWKREESGVMRSVVCTLLFLCSPPRRAILIGSFIFTNPPRPALR
jgi:hypothetical protein